MTEPLRKCGEGGAPGEYLSLGVPYILAGVTKRLVDIDDTFLDEARSQLGTSTIKDTVNEALRRAGAARQGEVARALDVLGSAPWLPREDAWR